MMSENEKLSVLLKVKSQIDAGQKRLEREQYEQELRLKLSEIPEAEQLEAIDREISQLKPVEEANETDTV